MKKLLLALLVLSLVGCGTQTAPVETTEDPVLQTEEPTTTEPEETTEPVATTEPEEETDDVMIPKNKIQAIGNFNDKTFEALLKGEENENYSGLSLYLALSMVTEGADDETLQELLDILQVEDKEALRALNKEILQSALKDEEDAKLFLANSIWTKEGFPIKEDYLKTLEEDFNAQGFERPFDEATASEVSQWIAEHTNDLIKADITISDDLVAMLINTIYFKGSWIHAFTEGATVPDTFHGVKGDNEKEFMKLSKKLSVMDEEDFQAVSLPFSDGTVMHFVMPKEGTLKDFLENHPVSSFKDFDWQYHRVNLSLPKFEYENDYNLSEMLQGLGLTSLFNPETSNLSGISDDLYVSQIRQLSKIMLDEKGVEAAAATIIDMETTSIDTDEPLDLTFNKPFMTLIETSDGLPLFTGAVVE